MTDAKLIDDLTFDKRVSHRFVSKGKITQAQLLKHLKDLPDMADSCDNIGELIFGDLREAKKANGEAKTRK